MIPVSCFTCNYAVYKQFISSFCYLVISLPHNFPSCFPPSDRTISVLQVKTPLPALLMRKQFIWFWHMIGTWDDCCQNISRFLHIFTKSKTPWSVFGLSNLAIYRQSNRIDGWLTQSIFSRWDWRQFYLVDVVAPSLTYKRLLNTSINQLSVTSSERYMGGKE